MTSDDPVAEPSGGSSNASARAVVAFGCALLAASHLVLVEAWRAPAPRNMLPAVFALAVAAWVMLGLPMPGPLPAAARGERGAASRVRLAVAAIGVSGSALAVAALHARGDLGPGSAYWGIFALWSGSACAATLAFAVPGTWLEPGGLRAWLAARRAPLGDAAALLAAALAVRLLALGTVPSIVIGDEGVFGNAARWMAQGGTGHMFGTLWANATLYVVPHALLERLIGPSALALRLPTAIGGALAAPATYALGRAFFGRRVGLVAGALMAVNHLHVHLSRDGLGHGLDATLAAVAIWGLASGVLRRSTGRAAVGGLALGLAQYGYVGARLIDLIAAAWVAWMAATAALAAIRHPKGSRMGRLADGLPLASVATALVVALATAGPMIRWALVRPGDYLSRLGAEGLVQSGAAANRLAQMSPLALTAHQVLDAALAFGSAPATAFYFSRFAALDVVTTALLALGVVIALRRPAEPRLAYLGLHLVGGIATLALARNASVSLYRVSGILPAALVLAALALWTLLDALFGRRPAAARRTAGLLVAGVCAFHLGVYWRGFAPGCDYWDPLTAMASRVGSITAQDAPAGAVFVLGRPDLRIGDFESAQYLADREVWRLAGPGDGGSVTELPLGAIIPKPDDHTAGMVLFDVPVGMDAADLAALVRTARHPTLVFAAPSREPALAALLAAAPGARRQDIVRCSTLLGTVATWPAGDEPE